MKSSRIQRARALLGPETLLEDEALLRLVEPRRGERRSVFTLTLEGELPRALTLTLTQPDRPYDPERFDPVQQQDWVTGTLERLSRGPSAQLHTLTIQHRPDREWWDCPRWLVSALAKVPLPALRQLSWGDDLAPGFVNIPKLDALRAGTPNLCGLHLMGDWANEDPRLSTQGLRALSLLCVDRVSCAALAALQLQAIEHMTLRLGDDAEPEPEALGVEDLAPLLIQSLPALRRLDLTHCRFGPALIEALPEAPWFGALEHLSLREARDGDAPLPEPCEARLRGPSYAHLRPDLA